MNKLFEIAKELSEIAQKRFEIKQKLSLYEMQQSARETAMTPEGGWPGSNDMQRKAEEKKAKANDPELIGLSMSIHDLNYDFGQLEVDRDAMVEERDAIRWTIRDNEVCAVSGDSVLDKLAFKLIDKSETPFTQTAEVLSEDEVKAIEEEHERVQREQDEERMEQEAAEQTKTVFVPGSVDDPSSPDWVPF
jgi:hypothetical protein